jgi:ketosteroid isomerase-like protein
MDDRTARRFADDWYAAWNAHDLEAILAHYTDDVVLTSPLAGDLAGSTDGSIVGKKALRAYFAAGLERFPALHFEPRDLYVGVDSLVLRYVGPTGAETAEVVFLDDDGKVSRYFAHYARPATA